MSQFCGLAFCGFLKVVISLSMAFMVRMPLSSNVKALRAKREVWLLKYEQATSPILSSLALVYLFTFSYQSIFYEPTETWFIWFTWFGNFLWVLFAIDLLYRFFLADGKKLFFVQNWLDTITVVIPQLRVLRVLRAFTANGIIAKKGGSFFSGGAVATAVVGVVLIGWVGALAVLNAERYATNGTIKTFGESIWWMFETLTTVGYGDYTPVTLAGRVVAVSIMLLGISLLGVVSASLAASLLKQKGPDVPAEILEELQGLKSLVSQLNAQLVSAGIGGQHDVAAAKDPENGPNN